MTELRQLGVLLGIAVFIYFFLRFRHSRVSRFDFALSLSFSGAILLVALFPGAVTILRDMLALEKTQFSRLIAVSILSNVVLWFLFLNLRIRNSLERRHFDRLVRYVAVEDFKKKYPELLPLPPITVILPAYNEAENIGHVLAEMPSEIQDRALTALVIDDGSDDGTSDRVRELGFPVVKCPVRRGGGAALRVGFDIAGECGAEIVVTMDADGQHLCSDIEGLVTPIIDQRCPFVIGSRLLGKREQDSVLRLAGIHLFNRLIHLLTPVRITDCSNGFRALKLSELNRLNLHQDQYHTTELIIEAAKKKVAVGEAPVTVKRRLSGTSKKGNNWKYGFRFAWTIFRTWWR